ncbi:hypothetical protein LIA77_11673 [Sarocladium implicatum]|nr:hypothetical protein LIA77_11673 [Sarocladium implicatum]
MPRGRRQECEFRITESPDPGYKKEDGQLHRPPIYPCVSDTIFKDWQNRTLRVDDIVGRSQSDWGGRHSRNHHRNLVNFETKAKLFWNQQSQQSICELTACHRSRGEMRLGHTRLRVHVLDASGRILASADSPRVLRLPEEYQPSLTSILRLVAARFLERYGAFTHRPRGLSNQSHDTEAKRSQRMTKIKLQSRLLWHKTNRGMKVWDTPVKEDQGLIKPFTPRKPAFKAINQRSSQNGSGQGSAAKAGWVLSATERVTRALSVRMFIWLGGPASAETEFSNSLPRHHKSGLEPGVSANRAVRY